MGWVVRYMCIYIYGANTKTRGRRDENHIEEPSFFSDTSGPLRRSKMVEDIDINLEWWHCENGSFTPIWLPYLSRRYRHVAVSHSPYITVRLEDEFPLSLPQYKKRIARYSFGYLTTLLYRTFSRKMTGKYTHLWRIIETEGEIATAQ